MKKFSWDRWDSYVLIILVLSMTDLVMSGTNLRIEYMRHYEELQCKHTYEYAWDVAQGLPHHCTKWIDKYYYYEKDGLGWEYIVTCFVYTDAVPIEERRPMACRDSHGKIHWR